MALTISLLSIKGGVGKTSASVNLAAQAAIGGLRTLVVDLDPQGGATYTLGVDERVDGGARAIGSKDYALKRAIVSTPWLGIDVVPADFSLRHLDLDLAARGKPKRRLGQVLRPLGARYDIVLIDCAPGITLANESAIRASDVALVPVVPSTLPTRAFEQLHAYIHANHRLENLTTLGFFSMVDRRKRMHRDVVASLGGLESAMLRTTIPSSVAIETMPLRRSPLLPTSRALAPAVAYRDLWRELQTRLFPTSRSTGPAGGSDREEIIDLTVEAESPTGRDHRSPRVGAARQRDHKTDAAKN